MNHYDRLKVPVDATPEEIEAAFDTWKWTFNPDTARDPANAINSLTQAFSAYRILRDPDCRREYDQRLASQCVPLADPTMSEKEFAYWMQRGPLTERLATGIRQQQGYRANPYTSTGPTMTGALRDAFGGIFSFLGVLFCLSILAGLVWVGVTIIKWFWSHPLW